MDFREKHKIQKEWLLQGNPTIRYQTLRDLVNTPVKDLIQETE